MLERFGSKQLHTGVEEALARLKRAAEKVTDTKHA
jgi:hypothetical protein